MTTFFYNNLILENTDPIDYVDRFADHLIIEGYTELFDFTTSLGDFSSTGVASHDQFESTLDGPPVLRTYNNFTVNAGHTVTPTQ